MGVTTHAHTGTTLGNYEVYRSIPSSPAPTTTGKIPPHINRQLYHSDSSTIACYLYTLWSVSYCNHNELRTLCSITVTQYDYISQLIESC